MAPVRESKLFKQYKNMFPQFSGQVRYYIQTDGDHLLLFFPIGKKLIFQRGSNKTFQLKPQDNYSEGLFRKHIRSLDGRVHLEV